MTHPWNVLESWALRQPEHPALIEGERVITYDALHRQVGAIGARLRARGLMPGQRLAVALPNGIPFILAYLGAFHAGLTLIPLNPDAPPEALDQLLALSRPHFFLRSEHLALLTDEPSGESLPFVAEQPEIGAIFFTSGTTGTPKGVCHDVGTLIDNVRAFNEMVGLGNGCRMLHVLPMFYMAGFLNTVLSPLVAGGAVVIAPRFTPQTALAFWKPAMAGAIDTAWLTPTMLAMLTRLYRESAVSNWCREHLTRLFVGTAPLPATVRDAFADRFGVAPLESYGMTEVLLTATHLPGVAGAAASAGKLLPGVIMEADGGQDEENHPELKIVTPYRMKGYWVAPEEPLISGFGRSFSTGDCGYVDEAGYLHITGRLKDLIIRGGVNVSPRAVEEVLLRHPAIAELCVLGMPHTMLGEEVAAWIVLKPDCPEEVARRELPEFARRHLVADAAPTLWRFVAALPRNATGKVVKQALRTS